MSGRRQRYPFSVIRERLRARGGDVLDFALGSAGPPLSEPLESLIRRRPELALQRAGGGRQEVLIQAFSDMMSRTYGIDPGPGEVLPAPASRLAMSAMAACFLKPGDGVLVTEPGYPAFARVAVHHHATIQRVSLDPDHGFAPVLDEARGVEIRLAGLNYPNNPTGATLEPSIVEALGRRLPTDAVILNDAAYGPLTYGRSPTTLLAVGREVGISQPMLELHSLAKLFSLGPQGLSFLVGEESLIGELREFTEFLWAPPSALQVELGSCALRDEAHQERVRDFFSRRVGRLRQVLEAGGFKPYPTPAGLYVLCEVPGWVGGQSVESGQQAAERLLDDHDLAVVGWDVPPHTYLRFSALYRERDLEALAELLRDGDLVSSG